MPPPPWQQSLQDAEALFSKENDLGGHVMSRTYGIDTSPLGDMLAVNSSNHPSDGVEYIIASDQISSLSIVSAREVADHEILPMSGGPSHPSGMCYLAKVSSRKMSSHMTEITAEAVLYSLHRFLERMPVTDLMDSILQQSLLSSFDLTNVPANQQYQMPITEDTPIRHIVREMQRNILFHRDSIASRNKRLVSFASKGIPKDTPPDAAAVRCIVTEVHRMPAFLSEAGDLSQTISSIHEIVLAKLEAREGRSELNGVGDQEVEVCSICTEPVAFESLRWARCQNGHQFSESSYG